MRITNQMMVQRQVQGLQSNIAAIDKAQTQVSSGKKITVASDDPTAATQILTADSALRAISQYKANVSSAVDRVNAEDSVVQQLGDLLTRAQEISVQQASGTATPETRAGAVSEVKGLLASAVHLANTKFGDEYLFGGEQSTTQPFAVNGSGTNYTTTNPTGQRIIQIANGETMNVAHTGTEVFVNTGALDALKNLAASLAANDVTGINTSVVQVNTAFDNVQGVVGDVGARANHLDMTSSHLDAFELSVKTAKSNLEDVDAATAITELTSRQTAYQAALLAISKSTGLSLTDYLR